MPYWNSCRSPHRPNIVKMSKVMISTARASVRRTAITCKVREFATRETISLLTGCSRNASSFANRARTFGCKSRNHKCRFSSFNNTNNTNNTVEITSNNYNV
jgi:hypothetical protein